MSTLRIFVDMDGVLSDFDKRYFELFNVKSIELKQAGKLSEYDDNWNMFVSGRNFATLEKYEKAYLLIDFLNTINVEKSILSSASCFDLYNEIREDKEYWLRRHGIYWPAVVVPGKKYKKAFADPNSILIDDTASNVNDFRNYGGSAILHETVEKTIEEVKKWLKACNETHNLQLSQTAI